MLLASILDRPAYWLSDLYSRMSTIHATHHLFAPKPTATPLPVWAAVVPPLTYYMALFLLPPLSKSVPKPLRRLTSFVKFALAAISAYTFGALPFKYYYPGSAVLTYQLGLVGWYGASRVIDVFFLSCPRVPRRIFIANPSAADGVKRDRKGVVHPYPSGPNETWKTEPLPKRFFSFERAWWALDLMISMRGIGWDFASADVRHDSHPWQPPSSAQMRRAMLKLLPILIACTWTMHELHPKHFEAHNPSVLDLEPLRRILFVAATGISLYTMFDFGYTLTSAVALPILHDAASATARHKGISRGKGQEKGSRVDRIKRAASKENTADESETETETEDDAPESLKLRQEKAQQLSLRNIDFFPLLNPAGYTKATTVRRFWSYAWHRLFGRPFGVYGILPFTYVAYLLEDIWQGKLNDPKRKQARREIWPSYHPDPMRSLERGRADWAKVLGAFTASGIIHAVSERAALGGRVAVPVTNIWLAKDHAKGMGHELRSSSAISGFGWGRISPLQFVLPISGAGEFSFFFLNGVAVVLEGAVGKIIERRRRRSNKGEWFDMWYDKPITIAWTLSVLLFTGQAFVEGWIRSGISKELGLVFD